MITSFKQFINEATLSGKTTDGRLSVEKYVVDNPKALEIDFEIEKTKKDVPVYDETGSVISFVRQGTTFRLRDKTLYLIDDKPALNTSIGYIQIRFIRKPSGFKAMDAEIKATNDLNDIIKNAVRKNNGQGIDIKIGRYTVKDVVSASSDHIKGDPKADIALFNSNGKEVGFISHKKEGGAKGFSQYGGISIKSGLRHKEIDSFIEQLAIIFEENRPKSGDAFYRPLKDPKLINASIYGPEFGKGFSRENCHCIGQGTPILTKSGSNSSTYELSFSETMHVNGEVSWAQKGKSLAVFGATFRNGRRVISANGVEVRNIRAGIYPIAYMETRKKLQKV